ncbi:putative vanilly-alcohol oxidase [Daldinia caldariorum]|uniref:putative vanilly-alcohol oxidase n=1 Tax=Daldinia caldariorum TaxID=326644 RepID=UPI0020085172|nr:putative vanilly-alcohol oxidase [Daldinia caldariorum]KAI1469086.1 putative vanilly-alcohol oxidase [Daldinia caldariorum]
MSFLDEAQSEVPLLSENHSGIPEFLLEKAWKAKVGIFETRTKPKATKERRPVIPPGVEEQVFATALDELSKQLGQGNVERNDKELKDGWYMEHPNTHDLMTILDEEELVPSAMVYPGSTEEVQQVVLWANKYHIPIFPISMGRNLGYGGAAPRVRGSVLVDLGRRMNKILDISPEDYTCLLEPGVSFFALYEAIKAKGYDHLWIDVPDVGGGSVIGNTVDRGVGYTPYGDHWACHSGLEVVLPTGEVIRTGMGALPGNNTWQTFPYGFGPYSDGIFSQSNFGIVTKMGMTLMPNPGGHEGFIYTFQKEEDLDQLIEIIRPLRISNILENVAQLRHVTQTIAVRGRPRTDFYKGEGTIPDNIVHEVAATLPIGDHTWVYYGMSYGPPHIRQYKLSIIDTEFKKVPGARRINPSTLPQDEYFWARDRIASGTPELEELRWVNWMPNGAHIAFSPVSPIRGTDATKLFELAKCRHKEFGVDLFPAFCVGLREMHLIVELVYDRADPKRRKDVLDCLRYMVDDAAACGYGEYRTHLVLMDQVAGTYNWNDGALMKFHEKLKDALDPNGIMAPGRCGIWPKKYRNRGWEMTKASGENSQGDGVASLP